MTSSSQTVVGPHFEDLEVGLIAATAPPMTLTAGHAALHQAILGDRLVLPLDAGLSERVVGGRLAHPGLVCDVAIGQSTLLTQRVIANLFYRGLVLHRAPLVGDTLRTSVEVVGLRQNRAKPDRAPTGLAALRVSTRDQEDRSVLDFHRCAMLPLDDPEIETGHMDDLAAIGADPDQASLAGSFAGWDLKEFRRCVPGPHFAELRVGQSWALAASDVVSNAPELARLTLNVAGAHHDASTTGSGERLVYGGHTIGLVGSQVARCLPALVTIVGWRSCDHNGPVFEGDAIRSEVEVERLTPLSGGGGLVEMRAIAHAHRAGGARWVLDWRLIGVMA